MNDVLFSLVVAVLFSVSFFIALQFKQQYTLRIMMSLYQKEDPHQYLQQLDTFLSKWIISKKIRILLSVDAYVMLNDTAKVNEIFDYLSNSKLTVLDRLSLLQKQITYYVENKKHQEAIECYESYVSIISGIKNNKNLLANAEGLESLLDVYVYHKKDVKEYLLNQIADEKNETVVGVLYYRLAVCAFYNNELGECSEYLNRAFERFKGSKFEEKLQSIIEDNSKIKDTII